MVVGLATANRPPYTNGDFVIKYASRFHEKNGIEKEGKGTQISSSGFEPMKNLFSRIPHNSAERALTHSFDFAWYSLS